MKITQNEKTTQNGQVTQAGTKVRHYAENGAITQNNISQVTQRGTITQKRNTNALEKS